MQIWNDCEIDDKIEEKRIDERGNNRIFMQFTFKDGFLNLEIC